MTPPQTRIYFVMMDGWQRWLTMSGRAGSREIMKHRPRNLGHRVAGSRDQKRKRKRRIR
jgi:hypothetical protein